MLDEGESLCRWLFLDPEELEGPSEAVAETFLIPRQDLVKVRLGQATEFDWTLVLSEEVYWEEDHLVALMENSLMAAESHYTVLLVQPPVVSFVGDPVRTLQEMRPHRTGHKSVRLAAAFCALLPPY